MRSLRIRFRFSCPWASLLTLRIQAFRELSDADRKILATLANKRTRRVKARVDIASEGDPPRAVIVVLDGWGCRYKQLNDGRRQILSLLLPGDMCDASVPIVTEMDHSIGAITPMTIGEISIEDFAPLLDNRAIRGAVRWSALATVAMQREWTTSLGQRNARERIAHLLCEIWARMRHMDADHDGACEFPLTQADIAEATGLTPVHVNRMIMDLRRDRLIDMNARTLSMHDFEALSREALFNPTYLHLDQLTGR